MYQRTIQIENEIEWIKVKQILEANEIPFNSNQFNDSAFPVLDNDRDFYLINIAEKDSRKYFRLIDEDYPNRIVEVEKIFFN
ncbi:MAG: hypothetical protein AAFZ15_31260, partial [Bacteroidota bacterium]